MLNQKISCFGARVLTKNNRQTEIDRNIVVGILFQSITPDSDLQSTDVSFLHIKFISHEYNVIHDLTTEVTLFWEIYKWKRTKRKIYSKYGNGL